MASLYRYVIKQVGARILALQGGQAAAAATAYDATTWASARFPVNLIVDTITDAVGNFAQVIAETAEHPFRRYLQAQTANIAHKGQIPATDSGGKDIIGIYGAVRDATDSIPLTEKPLQYITRCVRLRAGGELGLPVYHFARVDGRLYHTRDNVIVEVCSFDRDAERALILAEVTGTPGNSMLLPDSLLAAVVAETLAMLVQGDEFVQQAQHYRGFADSVKAQIRSGLVSVSSDIPEVEGQ